MVKKILISLGATVCVSCLVGLLYPPLFVPLFILSFIGQVAFFYIFNSITQNRFILKAEEFKIQQIKEASRQVAVLECPCNERYKQEVDMRFDRDIVYECLKCKKNLKADISVKTALTTQPIYFNDRS